MTLSQSAASRTLRAEDVEAYHRDGFVIARGFLSTQELAAMRAVCAPEKDLSALQTEIRDGSGRTYKVAIWTDLDDSLFGKLPRMPRIVKNAETLIGGQVYHWHSKLLRKKPGDGGVGVHQDFATWYEDGCLAPNMLTCTLAIHRNDRENGCLYLVPGSHKMARIHRVLLGETSDTHGPEPSRVAALVERNGLVYADLEAGDALFFHCMTLHGSEPNRSERLRTVVHCSYNGVDNKPIARPGQEHHRYRPLKLVSDRFLSAGDFSSAIAASTFHAREREDNPGAGIFYRQSDHDVAS